MTKLALAAGTLLGALVLPATASAQICAGFPTVDRQFSFGGAVDFPEVGDKFGIEAGYNPDGPLAVFAGVELSSFEDESDVAVGAGGAFELPAMARFLGPNAAGCPVVWIWVNPVSDVGTFIDVPIGLGVGGAFAAGPVVVYPYVIPKLVVSTFAASDDALEGETDTWFAVAGGVLVGFGPFYAGPSLRQVFEEDVDPLSGIRAGIRM